jgi:hypothetical protein
VIVLQLQIFQSSAAGGGASLSHTRKDSLPVFSRRRMVTDICGPLHTRMPKLVENELRPLIHLGPLNV